MNRNLIIGIVVICVVILAVMLFNNMNSPTNTTVDVDAPPVATEPAATDAPATPAAPATN